MRRPPHGATSCPGPVRPAAGYGRPLGRPGPYLVLVGSSPVSGEQSVGDGSDAVAAVVVVAELLPVAQPVPLPVSSAGAADAAQAVISVSASASPAEPGPTPAA